MTFRDLLAREFAPHGSLSADQLRLLEEHYQLLERWNRKINLTRITSITDVVRLHYCESLFLAQALPSGSLRIADIGSGGGFPGIPLAILRPESAVDLIESHQRKAVFLAEASRDLPNVRVISKRAESCEPNFDWMIARAVLPADVLSLALAPKAALLLSGSDLQDLPGMVSHLKVPWGEDRVIGMFHVERGRDKI